MHTCMWISVQVGVGVRAEHACEAEGSGGRWRASGMAAGPDWMSRYAAVRISHPHAHTRTRASMGTGAHT